MLKTLFQKMTFKVFVSKFYYKLLSWSSFCTGCILCTDRKFLGMFSLLVIESFRVGTKINFIRFNLQLKIITIKSTGYSEMTQLYTKATLYLEDSSWVQTSTWLPLQNWFVQKKEGQREGQTLRFITVTFSLV